MKVRFALLGLIAAIGLTVAVIDGRDTQAETCTAQNPDISAQGQGDFCVWGNHLSNYNVIFVGLNVKGRGEACVTVTMTPPDWSHTYCHTNTSGKGWVGIVGCFTAPEYDESTNYTGYSFEPAPTRSGIGVRTDVHFDLTYQPKQTNAYNRLPPYSFWSLRSSFESSGPCNSNCVGDTIYYPRICWEDR